MTEHDPLFDHLRRQLHDYGPPPPESVWAGIRQQVPAPRAPRPWRLPALLALLVLTLTFTARYWRPLFHPAAPAAASRAAQPAGTQPAGFNAEPGQPAGPANRSTQPTGLPKLTTPPENEAKPLAAGTPDPVQPTARGAAAKALHRKPAAPQLIAGGALASSARRRAEALLALAPAGRPRRAARWPQAQAGPVAGSAGPATAADSDYLHFTPALDDDAVGSSRYRRAGRALADGFRPLAFRRALLELPARQPAGSGLPPVEQQPEAGQLPRLPADWSVQVLAGPGLTYRLLGRSATQLQRLERPAAGFSGQLMVAYTFSPRLTLAAGLGYAQYATTLRYQLASRRPDSVVAAVDFRDQYHFLTVPVQARLALGGNHRWRYGVLGGAELAVLTSARTTEGSPCYCRQQRWLGSAPGSDSTFRSLNLALTAGAFASYQFRPGQWLTIQPQAQLFANPLNAAGSAARRPWNLGLQLGYRWELPPRRR